MDNTTQTTEATWTAAQIMAAARTWAMVGGDVQAVQGKVYVTSRGTDAASESNARTSAVALLASLRKQFPGRTFGVQRVGRRTVWVRYADSIAMDFRVTIVLVLTGAEERAVLRGERF